MDAETAQPSRVRALSTSHFLLVCAGVLTLVVLAYLFGRYSAPQPVAEAATVAEPLDTQLTLALDHVAAERYHDALDMLIVEAEQHAEAQFALGMMYERGQGVAQDHRQAYQWYLKASEQNHAQAQYALASMYAYGYGVPRDTARAALWSSRAIENGYGQAVSAEIGG